MPTGFDTPPDVTQRMIDAYRAGSTCRAAAAIVGLSAGACKLALKRAGVPARNNSDAKRIYAVNHDYFANIDTPDKAYWLGFFTADGCVSDAGRVTVSIMHTDAAHLRLFAKAIGTMPVHMYPKYGVCSVNAVSKQLARDLLNLGVTPRKSLTVEPWAAPEALAAHYWRGLIDGDGTVRKNKPSTIIYGSQAIVYGFTQFAARTVGSRATPHKVPNANLWYTEISGLPMLRLLYGNTAVALDRKRIIAMSHMTPEEHP